MRFKICNIINILNRGILVADVETQRTIGIRTNSIVTFSAPHISQYFLQWKFTSKRLVSIRTNRTKSLWFRDSKLIVQELLQADLRIVMEFMLLKPIIWIPLKYDRI